MTNIIKFKPVLATYTFSYDITVILSFLKREKERFMNVCELFKPRKAQKRSLNVQAVNDNGMKSFRNHVQVHASKTEELLYFQNNNQGFKNVN